MKQYQTPEVEVILFAENDFAAQIATSEECESYEPEDCTTDTSCPYD